ncbi:hypothetical protein NUSPORA_00590 [Nucleospora cyclopteri]
MQLKFIKFYDPAVKKVKTYKTTLSTVKIGTSPENDMQLNLNSLENLNLILEIEKENLSILTLNTQIEYNIKKEEVIRIHTIYLYFTVFDEDEEEKYNSSDVDNFILEIVEKTVKSTKRSIEFKDANGNNVFIDLKQKNDFPDKNNASSENTDQKLITNPEQKNISNKIKNESDEKTENKSEENKSENEEISTNNSQSTNEKSTIEEQDELNKQDEIEGEKNSSKEDLLIEKEKTTLRSHKKHNDSKNQSNTKKRKLD